jgi:hypothetical protein
MAVISAVAEHADLAPRLTNPKVAQCATDIAGRFRIIRAEIAPPRCHSETSCALSWRMV